MVIGSNTPALDARTPHAPGRLARHMTGIGCNGCREFEASFAGRKRSIVRLHLRNVGLKIVPRNPAHQLSRALDRRDRIRTVAQTMVNWLFPGGHWLPEMIVQIEYQNTIATEHRSRVRTDPGCFRSARRLGRGEAEWRDLFLDRCHMNRSLDFASLRSGRRVGFPSSRLSRRRRRVDIPSSRPERSGVEGPAH